MNSLKKFKKYLSKVQPFLSSCSRSKQVQEAIKFTDDRVGELERSARKRKKPDRLDSSILIEPQKTPTNKHLSKFKSFNPSTVFTPPKEFISSTKKKTVVKPSVT